MTSYFSHLNYTLGDEDPAPEMELLPYNCEHVLAIADCGSRIVPLLAQNPKKLTCVDINRQQLAVCELRIALLRSATLEEYKLFLGYEGTMPAISRKALFERLYLSKETEEILLKMFEHIGWGSMLYCGKFEQMLKKLQSVNSLITGKAGRLIFEFSDLDSQKRYFKNRFPHWRWRFVLALLGNSTALNSLLYKGDFPKKNRRESHFAIYNEIFRTLLGERLAKESFFLQMLFFGKIIYKEGLPIECSPEIFEKAKQSVNQCDISYFHGDVIDAANQFHNLDFISMSDVPSFFDSEREASFLNLLRENMLSGGKVVVRAHLRRPTPSIEGFFDISQNHCRSTNKESTQLWSFHIYERKQFN